MNETIRYFIQEIEQQYADMVTEPTAEIMEQLNYMYHHNMLKLTVCEIIAWAALAVSFIALWILIYGIHKDQVKGRHS